MTTLEQIGHRREVVVELLDDQLAHGETGLGNTEIDTLPQLTRRVLGCQHLPCQFRQSHQRLAAFGLLAGHGFRVYIKTRGNISEIKTGHTEYGNNDDDYFAG